MGHQKLFKYKIDLLVLIALAYETIDLGYWKRLVGAKFDF